MITMPMIVNSAPTSRTVTAPQPKGRAGGFLRAATAAYARGMVMGMDSSDADGLRVCDDDPSSNKSFRPFRARGIDGPRRSEEHTSELQSLTNLVCRLLLEKKKKT